MRSGSTRGHHPAFWGRRRLGRSRFQAMTIAVDLRRGFFRLWIVASLLWVGGVLAVEYRDTAIPSLTKSCSELLTFTLDKTGEKLGPADVARCDQVWQEERVRIAGEALGPPIAFLLAGVLLAWIVSGFRRRGA
jgi:hypothetical protein